MTSFEGGKIVKFTDDSLGIFVDAPQFEHAMYYLLTLDDGGDKITGVNTDKLCPLISEDRVRGEVGVLQNMEYVEDGLFLSAETMATILQAIQPLK